MGSVVKLRETPSRDVRKQKGGALKLDKSYNFTDKAEIIDEFFTAADRLGYTNAFLSNESGVSITTFRNWRSGKTERPQVPTIAMAGRRCLGWKLGWVKK